VLYEMATGRRAFAAESKTSLIAAIVASQPAPISSVVATVPPALDHVVQRCLEKDPDDRWQSARDIASELQWISEAGSQAGVATSVTMRRKTREKLTWLVAAGAVILAGFFALALFRERAARPTPSRVAFEIIPPEGHSISSRRLSPDGRRILYLETDKDRIPRLVVRDIGAPRSRVLAGTEHASGYFAFSPDGKWVAFLRGWRLYKIAVDGGSPVKLTDYRMNPRGRMTWGRDGRIYLAPHFAAPKLLFQVYMTEGTGSQDREGIYIASPGATGKTLVMKQSGSNWLYAGGFIVRKDLKSAARLLLHRLDEENGTLVGDPLTVDLPIEAGFWDMSHTGVIIFHEPRQTFERELVWFDRTGNRLGTVGRPGSFSQPRLSRDATHVAVKITGTDPAERGLWVYDLGRGSRNRIAEGGDVYSPQWSVDGLHLCYLRDGDVGRIERIRRDGVGQPEILAEELIWLVDAASNGDLLGVKEGPEMDTYRVLPVEEGGDARIVATGELGVATLSPDDSLIVYEDLSSAPTQLYVQRTDGAGLRVQVTATGGIIPRWPRGGNELFYFTPKDELMVAEIVFDGERIEVGEPQLLFETPTYHFNEFFDVSPDGQHFLVIVPVAEPAPSPITVLLNWTPHS
jgi:hypothetical protein